MDNDGGQSGYQSAKVHALAGLVSWCDSVGFSESAYGQIAGFLASFGNEEAGEEPALAWKLSAPMRR